MTGVHALGPGPLPDGLIAHRSRPLTGGFANPVWWCELDDGREVVVKLAGDDQPDLTEIEAEGLRVLAELGGLTTPAVVAFSPTALVLQAVGTEVPASGPYWVAAGHAVATMHSTARSERHGWAHDGWLGRFRQRNAWDADGYRFFTENRVLRYLGEPRVEAVLDADDRRAIERICSRLPELLPDTGAALTHGDLWRNNLLVGAAGQPVFVDPAVSYAWPEIDVAHALCSGRVPQSFFAAYSEIRALDADWREHARILNIRQLLALTASFGAIPEFVSELRRVIGIYG